MIIPTLLVKAGSLINSLMSGFSSLSEATAGALVLEAAAELVSAAVMELVCGDTGTGSAGFSWATAVTLRQTRQPRADIILFIATNRILIRRFVKRAYRDPGLEGLEPIPPRLAVGLRGGDAKPCLPP